MSQFQFVTGIYAPPLPAWEILLDLERWPEWTSSITRIERLTEGPLAVGSRVRIEQPKLMPNVWQVTEFEPRTFTFTWVTSRPLIRIAARHQLERTHEGSRLTLTLTYSGIVGWIMAYQLKDLNWQYLSTEAKGLKLRAETVISGR